MLLLRLTRLYSTIVDLGLQMKQLNDKKQFRKALSSFEKYSTKKRTSLVIDQALRACIHLNDFQRGKAIHQELPRNLLNNEHIRTTLIRLYSKNKFLERVHSNSNLLIDL